MRCSCWDAQWMSAIYPPSASPLTDGSNRSRPCRKHCSAIMQYQARATCKKELHKPIHFLLYCATVKQIMQKIILEKLNPHTQCAKQPVQLSHCRDQGTGCSVGGRNAGRHRLSAILRSFKMTPEVHTTTYLAGTFSQVNRAWR